MHKKNKRMAVTFLSLLAILALVLPATGRVSAQADPSQFSLKIRAYIDGISQLVLKGSNVTWQHISAAAPGRHGSSNEPTYLNALEWYPTWLDIPTAENIDCNCDSSTLADLNPALPGQQKFVLKVLQARGSAYISQQPGSWNDYTLTIVFDDWAPNGPAWYEVELVVDSYDIYVLNVKTGLVERLTALEGAGEYNPSWSPDGRKIVHDVAAWDRNDLYITDVSTHVSQPLSGAEGGNDADWSPNGKWIVFDRRWSNDSNLYLLPPSGGTPRLAVSNAVNGDWSPDSQRLVFEREGALWTAGVKGGDEKKIAEAGNNPVWSPDGMWIAYDLNGDLWKVRLNERGGRLGDPIQLTSSPASEGGPNWSQDSKQIAFGSNASDDYDIWQMPAAGGDPLRLVRTSIYGDYDPAYSSNGQYIAYDGARMPSQPYIAAFPEWGYIEGQDWPKDDTVHLTIDDPTTRARPDYEAEQPTVATSWGNWWVQFNFDYDLKVGDRVTETDGYVIRTYVVRNLAVTDVNTAANTAAGRADPGAVVYLWLWGQDDSYMELTATKNGTWLADFNSVGFSLAAGMCGRAEVRDKIGNRTAVDWCVP